MAVAHTLSGLARFPARGAGTDTERRTASWLSSELREAGLPARIETFWCRPNWALTHAWHVALALAGSLLAIGSPRIGGALILVSLLSVIADALLGTSLGRRLTLERASQNVVTASPQAPAQLKPIRLVITAGYDAGRTGLPHRPPLRRVAASLRALSGGRAPGWLAWLVIVLLWLQATALVRLQGSTGTGVAIAQLLPTVVLVLALALLLEQGTAGFGPGSGDNGSGVAAAVALARALAAGPPANQDVELVLQGAADGSAIGLQRYLRARRGALRPANTVVLGICACSAGRPRWWISDGQLIPVRYSAQLRRLASDIAAQTPPLEAEPVRTRGCSPALPAAMARIPALAVGALDPDGLVSPSHTPADTREHLDHAPIDRVVQLGLLLVEAIDDHLGQPLRSPADQPQATGPAERT